MNGVAVDVLVRMKTLRPKEGPNKNIMPNLEEELFRWAFESACTVFFDKRLGILDKNSPKIHPEIDEFVYAFQNVLKTTANLMFKNYNLQKMLRTKTLRTRFYGLCTALQGILNVKSVYTKRLYPVALGVGRKVTEDMEIGGYKIPAGVSVILDTYSISRSSEYFEDPYSFNPQRWLSRVKGEKLNNFLMLPFGFGVRSCIVEDIAVVMSISLVNLLHTALLVGNFVYGRELLYDGITYIGYRFCKANKPPCDDN
ncbi:cholesterol side-chain cleavage enzyme, mitochondrial-like [Anneissia japonica]|uniref:cholesterol side-chain cleavage enzyme, mitochondrial-like n=1 Tax=Anneissia japonica TaxID=1529436 RepID=UPI001425871D|nr:cholesterol side-chain cleavage enzyme, mitochondrial-like [Anneissia japonica]